MTTRSQEEIDRQIKGLEAQKEWLPEFSRFGDDNWGQIATQIEVLKGKSDASAFEENDDEDFDDNLYQAAVQAEDWLSGNIDEDLFEVRES